MGAPGRTADRRPGPPGARLGIAAGRARVLLGGAPVRRRAGATGWPEPGGRRRGGRRVAHPGPGRRRAEVAQRPGGAGRRGVAEARRHPGGGWRRARGPGACGHRHRGERSAAGRGGRRHRPAVDRSGELPAPHGRRRGAGRPERHCRCAAVRPPARAGRVRPGGLPPFLPRFASFDVLAGREVLVRDGNRQHGGVARGVAPDGGLRIALAGGGEQVFHGGETSVRAR